MQVDGGGGATVMRQKHTNVYVSVHKTDPPVEDRAAKERERGSAHTRGEGAAAHARGGVGVEGSAGGNGQVGGGVAAAGSKEAFKSFTSSSSSALEINFDLAPVSGEVVQNKKGWAGGGADGGVGKRKQPDDEVRGSVGAEKRGKTGERDRDNQVAVFCFELFSEAQRTSTSGTPTLTEI